MPLLWSLGGPSAAWQSRGFELTLNHWATTALKSKAYTSCCTLHFEVAVQFHLRGDTVSGQYMSLLSLMYIMDVVETGKQYTICCTVSVLGYGQKYWLNKLHSLAWGCFIKEAKLVWFAACEASWNPMICFYGCPVWTSSPVITALLSSVTHCQFWICFCLLHKAFLKHMHSAKASLIIVFPTSWM